MAKRVNKPPDGTSYNIYFAGGEGAGDTHIGKEYRGAESGKPGNATWKSDISVVPFSIGMSPQVLYTVRDAAQILEKAPVTVRKEARTRAIGTIKGQGYLFTDQDLLSLSASFQDKENRRRHPRDKASGEISAVRALFEQVCYLRGGVEKLVKERNSFMMMFNTFFNQLSGWQEEIERKLKRLEGG